VKLAFADCQLDSGSRELMRDGAPVAIEPRTLDLLIYLAENRDRAIGKDELQDKVWGTIVSDAAMTRAVMKLRKAVGDQQGNATIIKTVPRFGYRFIAIPDEAALPPLSGETGVERRGVAVLPLVNMSGDPENQYFSDGIAEEILNLLAKVPALRVASRTSSFAFRDTQQTVRQIADNLNVDIILEGSVRKAGDRVRITMQLIDAAADAHLWSEIYDRELTDIFAVQADIAKAVVAAMTRADAGNIPAYPATDKPEAYDLFLRGRQLFYEWDGDRVSRARVMFERATEIDPGYARAWAGVAYASSMLYMWWEASEENLRAADSASSKALELGPDLAEAHTARGFALTLLGDFDEAVEELDRALQLDSLSYDAWYLYGRARFAMGDFEESARLFIEAGKVRPDDVVSVALAGNSYQSLKDKERANTWCTEGVRRAEKYLSLNPHDTRVLQLGGACYEQLGEYEKGEAWINRALSIAPDDVAVLHNAGCFYAAAGQVDRALDIFERRFQLGDAYMDWIDNDADFDSIRDHPRFRKMIGRD
jgi:adenylate cyclase